MNILFLSDDPDDAAIFMDTITEFSPRIDCTIMASNENAIAAIEESAATTIFLDYTNLPERFVKNLIKLLRGDKRWENVKVIIYVSQHLLTKQISEPLLNSGIREFVFKTSDLKVFHKSIADVLK